mmetsp:Transcript_45455/g.108700  ORF Transcript_45455/g.108700 Transcript_45455/m.108700 type:complete len:228 (-) Transcript_45455:78-761(-)
MRSFSITTPLTFSPCFNAPTSMPSVDGSDLWATRVWTTAHSSTALASLHDRLACAGARSSLPPEVMLIQPISGPEPRTSKYLMRFCTLSSCSTMESVESLAPSTGDCVLSCFRTVMPPLSSPPTTIQTLPPPSGQSSGLGFLTRAGGIPRGGVDHPSATSSWKWGSTRYLMRSLFSTILELPRSSAGTALMLLKTPLYESSKPNSLRIGYWTSEHTLAFASAQSSSE